MTTKRKLFIALGIVVCMVSSFLLGQVVQTRIMLQDGPTPLEFYEYGKAMADSVRVSDSIIMVSAVRDAKRTVGQHFQNYDLFMLYNAIKADSLMLSRLENKKK